MRTWSIPVAAGTYAGLSLKFKSVGSAGNAGRRGQGGDLC